jgi:hypothetical protein
LVAPELVHDYRAFVARGFRRGLRAVAPGSLLKRAGVRGAQARDVDPHQWAELFLLSRSR